MKTFYLLLLTVLLFGCNISKNTTKSENLTVTEKTVSLDTTLKILQPIKGFLISGKFEETVKLETKDFKFVSQENYKTGERDYIFEVKNDTIKERVILTANEKTTVKEKTKVTEIKKSFFGFKFYLAFFSMIFMCALGILWIKRIEKRKPF